MHGTDKLLLLAEMKKPIEKWPLVTTVKLRKYFELLSVPKDTGWRFSQAQSTLKYVRTI